MQLFPLKIQRNEIKPALKKNGNICYKNLVDLLCEIYLSGFKYFMYSEQKRKL